MLTHYSETPVLRVRHARRQEVAPKPRGLWLSVDGKDDWAEWCAAESYPIGRIAHDVELAVGHNVAWLSGDDDIDRFHARYCMRPYPNMYYWYIDWRTVARDFDGIIIAPYCWGRRLQGAASDWYYGWDCASGCIWYPRAIASIEQKREAA